MSALVVLNLLGLVLAAFMALATWAKLTPLPPRWLVGMLWLLLAVWNLETALRRFDLTW